MARIVLKSSGNHEPFDENKFKRSLRRVGAKDELIESITSEVLASPELNSTHKIYSFAFERLRNVSRPIAARYSLKYALYELGPTGFIFEQFVGEIFKAQGYEVRTDMILQGVCVDHEVDLIVEKEGKRFMVECKFHNAPGIKTDVRDSLYTKARFEDLSAQWSRDIRPSLACNGVWLATNTQFTTKAITYGLCAGVTLLGWAYPHHKGIADLIDLLGLHPITSLTGLSLAQKRALVVDEGIILCRDLVVRQDLLEKLSIPVLEREKIKEECYALCNPQG